MNTREWLANELRASGRTAFDFFSDIWQQTYGKPCKSNAVALDAKNYNNPPHIVPIYVWSYWDRLNAQARRIPDHAIPGLTFTKQPRDLKLTLVAEEANVRWPIKQRSGKWMGP